MWAMPQVTISGECSLLSFRSAGSTSQLWVLSEHLWWLWESVLLGFSHSKALGIYQTRILNEMKAIYKHKCIQKKFQNSESIILGITETFLKIIWSVLNCLNHPIHNPIIKVIFQNLNVSCNVIFKLVKKKSWHVMWLLRLERPDVLAFNVWL